MTTRLLILGDNKILLMRQGGLLRLPLQGEIALPEGAETFRFPGYIAVGLADCVPAPAESEEYGLRESWEILSPADFAAATKGAELLNWNAGERFCSRDGNPLRRQSEISKICPCCGREYFPRLFPAVVVLVLKGEEGLLVHASSLRNPDVMTLVAGFVETGESLEECVRREVKEETDIDITDIRYFGSQAWPFPHQLMVGFTARYKGGTLRFADGEITAGKFFTREEIPVLPTMPSLSRMIIEEWRKGNFN